MVGILIQDYRPITNTTQRFEATLNGDIFIDETAIIPILIIPVEIENKSNVEVRIISIRMNIAIVTKQDSRIKYIYLGPAYEKQPTYTICSGGKCYIQISPQGSRTFYFAMPMHHELLMRLEKLRNGGDIKFVCEVFVWSMVRINNMYEPVFDKCIVKDRGRNEIVISRSDWVEKILNKASYIRLSIVELPAPKAPSDEILLKIMEYLNNAWKKYMLGEYYEAVTDIRRALDALKKEYFKKIGILMENQIDWGKLTNSQTEKEALKKMFDALSKLGGKAAHEGARSITRENAELAIITFQAFLKFILDLIRHIRSDAT